MDQIKLNKHSTSKRMNVQEYSSTDDMQEILSGDKSIYKVNKVSEVDNIEEMNKKIELSSNKDIDVGLELLINQEKRAKKVENDNENDNYEKPQAVVIENSSNRDSINFDNLVGKDTNVEELLNELSSVNERTSRLSQNEIDAIIDRNDATLSEQPNLVNDNDINNIVNNLDTNNEFENKSENQSQKFNLGRQEENFNVKSQYMSQDYNERYVPRIDPEQERKEKEEILWKLSKYKRLNVQGIKNFNMSSDLDEMRSELNKIKKQRELEGSIKFQRKCLMAFATGAELLNSKLDFLDFRLDGWSESVHEGIDEYNEVFEELHEKYKEKAQMAPEVKLVMMLGGSAFMYHITNSMFKNSAPGMEDIMKQNPELMKQFASAAINQMDSSKQPAANFFSNFVPGGMPPQQQTPRYEQPPMPAPGGPRPMPMRPSQTPIQQSVPNRNIPVNTRPSPQYTPGPAPVDANSSLVNNENINVDTRSEISAFNNTTRKIPAPVGVDDILDELRSNTDEISEVISRDSRTSKSVNINNKRQRPKRSISLNI